MCGGGVDRDERQKVKAWNKARHAAHACGKGNSLQPYGVESDVMSASVRFAGEGCGTEREKEWFEGASLDPWMGANEG